MRWLAIEQPKVPDDPRFVQPDSNPRGGMVGRMATEVAPGIHRLGNDIVDFYLVEDGDGLTLVDAGVPGFAGQLDAALAGRTVDAVVSRTGTPTTSGSPSACGRPARPSTSTRATPRWSATASSRRPRATSRGTCATGRPGGCSAWRSAPAGSAAEDRRGDHVADDTVLDVPGHPHAVHTPGHSNGHVALHFPDRGALLAGDAICTWNPLTGRSGPQLMSSAFAGVEPEAMSRSAASRTRGGRRAAGPRRPVDRRGARARARGRARRVPRRTSTRGWVGERRVGRGEGRRGA